LLEHRPVGRLGLEAAGGKRRCFCGKRALGKHDLARDPALPAWRRCGDVLSRRIVQRSIRIFPVWAEMERAFKSSGVVGLAQAQKCLQLNYLLRDAVMNLWFRLIWLLLTRPFQPKLKPPFEASILPFRVWFHDLDTSLHMNNARYWGLMDLGRADLMLRSGLWRAILRHGWVPVVNCGTIRFRREVRLFRALRLETRLLCWSEGWVVIQHRILADGRDGKEIVAAVALVRAALYDRKGRAYVPAARLFSEMGVTAESPEPSPEVAAFLAAEEAMRQAGAAVEP
jgi:acyl-CoA thioesterase FadM